jgi:hypothetical protein
MEREVAGVPLSRLEAPIQTALNEYQAMADNRVQFQTTAASRLVLTPDKPNSARSETNVTYRNSFVGKLFVIAFKPGDGTGSEKDRKLYDIVTYPQFPWDARIVPRNKTGIYAEGELAILSHAIDNVHADPIMYAGTFDLLTLDRNLVSKTHELGHPTGTINLTPLTTLTTGYTITKTGDLGERFGDPHAVFSSVPDAVQVGAFLAISDEMNRKHPYLLHHLDPQLPREI